MRLNDCRLVVMSACVSSVGELAGGDEVTGLTRAFQTAGAPDVIGTLWPVDNAATTSLMTAFYEEFQKDGSDPVKALCSAQRRTLKTLDHPRLWAAFELFGAGRLRDSGPKK
jgi:CHAT domain-containing protein